MKATPLAYLRPIAGTGQTLALGAASVPSAAFAVSTEWVQISSLGNCHVEVGVAPVATANSMLVKATDDPLVIRVTNGEQIAVIQDGTSTGNLNVVEMTY